MFGKRKEKTDRLLIVEDDALLAQVLTQSFVDENFEVLNINNGLKALAAAGRFKPDVILLDLVLPGLDGFGVLKRLKEESETASIPVVVVSNLDSVADVKSAKALGAEEFFIKANSKLEKIVGFIKAIVKK